MVSTSQVDLNIALIEHIHQNKVTERSLPFVILPMGVKVSGACAFKDGIACIAAIGANERVWGEVSAKFGLIWPKDAFAPTQSSTPETRTVTAASVFAT